MSLIVGLLVRTHSEEAVEEVLHAALTATTTAARTLILILIVIVAIAVIGVRWRLAETLAPAAALLLLLFRQRFGIDVDNRRAHFLGNLRKVSRQIARRRNLQLSRIRAVDLRLLSFHSMRNHGANQNPGRKGCQNRKSRSETADTKPFKQ